MKRRIKGVVVSHKMQKTAVVNAERFKMHPKYFKYYKISKKFKAHDEKNEYQERDVVIIEGTRPVSKEKKWRVVKLVSRSGPAASGDGMATEP